jgi:hypothetical protein
VGQSRKPTDRRVVVRWVQQEKGRQSIAGPSLATLIFEDPAIYFIPWNVAPKTLKRNPQLLQNKVNKENHIEKNLNAAANRY